MINISDQTRLSLANLAASGGDLESARSILAAAVEHDPRNADLQIHYCNALLDVGRKAEASKAAAVALSFHARDAALALKFGQVQLRAGDPAAAAATFESVVGSGPDGVAALNGLGVARVQQGQLPAATEAFRRAMTISPNDMVSRNNLALALVLQGRTNEAIPILRTLADDPTAPGRVRHNLALAYAQQGNPGQAAAALSGLIGANEAEQEANTLTDARAQSAATLVGKLGPVELVGARGAADPGAQSQPVPTASLPSQAPLPQAPPRVSAAPQVGFSATPLAPPPTTPQAQAAVAPLPRVINGGDAQVPAILASLAAESGPQPAAADAPPVAQGADVKVRLAEATSRDAAISLWRKLTATIPDLFAGRIPVFSKSQAGDSGAWQVGTGGFADAAAAEGFCRQLRQRGPECSVGL